MKEQGAATDSMMQKRAKQILALFGTKNMASKAR